MVSCLTSLGFSFSTGRPGIRPLGWSQAQRVRISRKGSAQCLVMVRGGSHFWGSFGSSKLATLSLLGDHNDLWGLRHWKLSTLT